MNERGVKRKKKTLFQKSMKYYKKGIHGRGVRIEDENFEYFLHILKVMNQNFESEEDRSKITLILPSENCNVLQKNFFYNFSEAFVENVFEQLREKEVEYSCNQVVSRIADNLLPEACDESVLRFVNAFSENIRPICMDPFGSFVLQKLLFTVTERYLVSLVVIYLGITLRM